MRRSATGQVLVSNSECPISSCHGRRERSQHIMCRDCWRSLHPTLQGQVWASLGERNRVAGGRPTRDQLRAVVDAYEDLRARAIASAERAIRRGAAA